MGGYNIIIIKYDERSRDVHAKNPPGRTQQRSLCFCRRRKSISVFERETRPQGLCAHPKLENVVKQNMHCFLVDPAVNFFFHRSPRGGVILETRHTDARTFVWWFKRTYLVEREGGLKIFRAFELKTTVCVSTPKETINAETRKRTEKKITRSFVQV